MAEEFIIQRTDDGTPIAYSCEELMANNEVYQLQVEYYYDILHDSGVDEATAVAQGEAALLTSVANNFGLIDGARCGIPAITELWLIDVTSSKQDEPVAVFDECLELVPGDGESCEVYKGYMTAHWLGDGDQRDFESYIQSNLNNIGGDQGIQISYLGATLDTSSVITDTGREELKPSSNKAESAATVEPDERNITFVGGLLVAGFLAAFLALFFVMYRRRQRFLSGQEMELALSKSDLDDMATRDGDPDSSSVRPEFIEPEIGEEEDEFPQNYRFDMASSMKNELFNIHGRAADPPRQYGIGIEETSDSDADSWAQTDGTIGSLELQLEPITAEV